MKENSLNIKRVSKLFKAICLVMPTLITLQSVRVPVKALAGNKSEITARFLKEIKVDTRNKLLDDVDFQAKVDEIQGNYDDSYNKENPLIINNEAELTAFAASVNGTALATNETKVGPYDFKGKYVRMENDIDLDGCGIIYTENDEGDNKLAIKYSGIAENIWSPIGTSANTSFKGTFDGSEHKIKNMIVVESSNSSIIYAGLFGYVSDATIENVGIDEGSHTISSSYISYSGGLIGYAYGNTKVTNSYVKGAVSSYYSFPDDVHYGYSSSGGLVGRSEGGKMEITNSYATGVVASYYSSHDSAASYNGGLVGSSNKISITNSYATGAVSSCSSSNNKNDCAFAGGLIGDSLNATIVNSYASGTVSSSSNNNYAGGLAGGSREITIINSYETGTVFCFSNNGFIGGILGYNYRIGEANIKNSYAAGTISPFSNNVSAGGLIGMADNDSDVRLKYSYWKRDNNPNIALGKGSLRENNDARPLTYRYMTSDNFVCRINRNLNDGDVYSYVSSPDHTPTLSTRK